MRWVKPARLPLLVAWPIFDMTFVTVTRLKRGQPPWVGGRDHTTHRLATWLGGTTRAFVAVLALSSLAMAAGLLAARGGTTVAAVTLGGAILLVTVLGLALARVPVR